MNIVPLTQEQADYYLYVRKVRAEEQYYDIAQDLARWHKFRVALKAKEVKDNSFFLDISQKKVILKVKCQFRSVNQNVILARLDLHGSHRNPDGTEIGAPHLHLYSQEFGDKVAVPVPEGMLKNPNDPLQVIHDFIIKYNIEENGLFGVPTNVANLPLFQ